MDVDTRSTTAVLVAAVRAYHCADRGPKIFRDTFARVLLSDADCEMFERMCVASLARLNPTLAASCSDRAAVVYQQQRAGAGSAPVLVRARYVEEALLEACDRGVRQYVILGAGLDTFAVRCTEMVSRLQVFEIDHPATQAFKRERLANAGLVPSAHVHFVAADLERVSVSAALGSTAYDPTVPAFLSWLGVTFYLSREAILNALRGIRGVAAPGTELVFDYFEPGAFSPGAPLRVASLLEQLKLVGEPMIFSFDPAALESELSREGFTLIEDIGPDAVQTRFLDHTDGFRAAEYWHLARATIR